jgi:hypothetical protein
VFHFIIRLILVSKNVIKVIINKVSGVSVQVSGQADSWEAGRPGSWKARLFATPSAL